MTRQGKTGVAKPLAEMVTTQAEAGDLHFALLGGQTQLAAGAVGPAETIAPAGNEQLVNTYTTSTQVGPVVTRSGAGNSNVAVAWVSFGEDGDGAGIYMRVLAPNGNAVTGELLVNQSTAGTQNGPSITALDNGNFVVVWHERIVLTPPPMTTLQDQVYFRIYTPGGAPITGQLTANSAIHKSDDFPSIAALHGGGFAITWSVEFDDGRKEIFVRTFNDAGVPNGNEQFANTFQGDTEISSRIAGLADGGFVVFWETRPSVGPAALRAQRFDGNGGLVGAEFAPHEQPGTEERVNDVIGLAGGGFVFLYSRGSALYARIYGADGVAIGGEKVIAAVNASSTGEELTALAGGGFAAGWDDLASGDVHGRLFDATGNPVSEEFTANQTTTGSQGFVDLVERADGSLLYAWSGNGTGDSAGVFVRAFTNSIVPINGTSGPDDLSGTSGADVMNGLGGSDILRGQEGNDTLNGNDGDDFLVGGPGNDIMIGGLGDDTYYIDSTSDQLSEYAGEGYDRIAATITLALAADADIERIDVENLASTNAIDLTGSGIANVIYGNDGVNILRGEAGNDELRGFGGNDFLVGGAGTDLMVGGLGDDTFYVDDASDAIGEIAGEGNDRIAASVSFVLSNGASVEVLEAVNVAATTAFDLTGSDSANTITGNAGANILKGEGGNDILNGAGGDDFLVGGAGNDIMNGGTGNDTYYVDSIGDVVNEFAGEGTNDRVATTVSYTLSALADIERLEAADSVGTAAMDLTGSASGNSITGNNGPNILDGKGGSDTLTGLGGNDTYQFTTALGLGNVDIVVGFVSGSDRIAIDDAIFTQAGPTGALNANAFYAGAAAHDADDRIIYNAATGALLYDADGTGAAAAVQFATLNGSPALAASDFVVI